jgi:hypothetical protein
LNLHSNYSEKKDFIYMHTDMRQRQGSSERERKESTKDMAAKWIWWWHIEWASQNILTTFLYIQKYTKLKFKTNTQNYAKSLKHLFSNLRTGFL